MISFKLNISKYIFIIENNVLVLYL